MKYIILLGSFLCIFSCKHSNNNTINIFPDSSNYEYVRINDTLQKVIRFFPQTKDTSKIYFYNTKWKSDDSAVYYYNKQGYLTSVIYYSNKRKIIEGFSYFLNGRIKRRFHSNKTSQEIVTTDFYENGKIKSIYEDIILNGASYTNTRREFSENGDLNKDSTFYYDMKIIEDTINIYDSVLVEFTYEIPKTCVYRLYTGLYDKDFNIIDSNRIERIKLSNFYYKPILLGKNFIRTYLEVKVVHQKNDSYILKMYNEIPIYVTE